MAQFLRPPHASPTSGSTGIQLPATKNAGGGHGASAHDSEDESKELGSRFVRRSGSMTAWLIGQKHFEVLPRLVVDFYDLIL